MAGWHCHFRIFYYPNHNYNCVPPVLGQLDATIRLSTYRSGLDILDSHLDYLYGVMPHKISSASQAVKSKADRLNRQNGGIAGSILLGTFLR